MIEITKKTICAFILLGSFVFSQCDDYSESQCNNDTICEWIVTYQWYDCNNFSNSSQCNSYSEYGCYWDSHWYYSGWSDCDGPSFQLETGGFCQEIEMPECSEMLESECGNSSDCEWIENIEVGNCSDITNGSECYQTNHCSWYSAGSYGYWYDNCYGGSYEIDNSYCEESDYIQGDLNGDLTLNILDVLLIIDIILNQESSDLADINGDGIVNILDVIELVELIINT